MSAVDVDAVEFQCNQLRAYFSDLMPKQEERCLDLLAHILKLQWNARGAADCVKIEAELTSMMGGTASGPYVINLDRAIKKLDH